MDLRGFSCMWSIGHPLKTTTHQVIILFFLRTSPRQQFFPANLRQITWVLSGSAGKESACNLGDLGSIPGLGKSPGEGKGYPLQYSGLENSMDCIVHGVAKSQTWLSDFHFHFSAISSSDFMMLWLHSVSAIWSVCPWGRICIFFQYT